MSPKSTLDSHRLQPQVPAGEQHRATWVVVYISPQRNTENSYCAASATTFPAGAATSYLLTEWPLRNSQACVNGRVQEHGLRPSETIRVWSHCVTNRPNKQNHQFQSLRHEIHRDQFCIAPHRHSVQRRPRHLQLPSTSHPCLCHLLRLRTSIHYFESKHSLGPTLKSGRGIPFSPQPLRP